MKLQVLRGPKGFSATFGIMLVDGQFECYTLENSLKLIPTGIYDAELYESPHNKTTVILLKNVPGRTEIEIHVANYPVELEGCIAVGRNRDAKQLIDSGIAFRHLMQKRISLATTIQVEVVDFTISPEDEVK